MSVFVAGATGAIGRQLARVFASNAKAERELERRPGHPSRRQGFAAA